MEAAVLAQPDAHGRLRLVGVSLPLSPELRRELVTLLRPLGDQLAELPGTVGGLPGSPPVSYLPVAPEVVVEVLADQDRPPPPPPHRPPPGRPHPGPADTRRGLSPRPPGLRRA
ncbi:hypothetical protein [Kitasatospora aureofaciens]|uniref:hypothetical protein n=1 Tax=Kitasatospora aureofaciens TaxID=1894 RepID=UPI0038139828